MRSETFHTPGDVTLRIRIPAGDVVITTEEGEQTRVELSGDPSVEEAARIEARGSEVTVELEERRFRLRTSHQVDVRVTCPPAARLEFRGVSTDLVVRGPAGPADVKTVSGDVRLERVGGELEVKSVSGDIAATAVTGRATIQTVSGDVRVDEAEGPVSVQTVSGDQRLGSVAEGAVMLKSVSGDLLVGVRSGSSLWVDAKSVSGDTSTELELGDAPPEDGGPLVELRATAMSGDIRVVRAG
jgi:DUF4097 and DUF4098 domain-containing protein YvlB